MEPGLTARVVYALSGSQQRVFGGCRKVAARIRHQMKGELSRRVAYHVTGKHPGRRRPD